MGHTTAPPTKGPRVAKFMRSYLRHTKGKWAGQRLVTTGFQDDALNEMFRVNPDGSRVYAEIDLGLPRKNAKSTIAAGIGLYLLGPDGEPGPEVYVAGGSSEQAGIVFGQAHDFIDSDYADPRLAELFVPRRNIIRCPSNAGFLRRLAADGKMNHGLHPHGIIMDELHAWVTDRQVANFEALTTAQGARENPFTLAISTAGDDPESILGRKYNRAMADPRLERVGKSWDKGLKAGLYILRDPATRYLFIWYGAEADADIENPAVWRACNPGEWVSLDFLKRQFASPNVPEVSFRKLHLNQFTKTKVAWFPWGVWLGLRDPALDVPQRIAVGVDVGLTNDTTAVSWAGVTPGGRVTVRTHVWSARDDVPHHTYVPGGRIELAAVEGFIRGLAGRHDIGRVMYDPRFFERSAQLLSDDGLTVAPLVQSSAPMADAYQDFYTGVTTGEIAHDGDAVLAAHVDATAAVQTERGWRVSKLKSNTRIDACVATAMAYYGALRMRDETPWIGGV